MLDEFIALARARPAHLCELLRKRRLSELEHSLALEALGYIDDPSRALPLLLEALEDAAAQVRVGAVCGLAEYLDEPTVRSLLEKVGAVDPSHLVREAVEASL